MRLAAPRPQIRQLLSLTKLDLVFDVFDSVELAAPALSARLPVSAGDVEAGPRS